MWYATNLESEDIPQHGIVISLCNEVGKAKKNLYTSILKRCSQAGCFHCREAQNSKPLHRNSERERNMLSLMLSNMI